MGAVKLTSIIDRVCVYVSVRTRMCASSTFYDFMSVDVYNEGPCVWGLVLFYECYCTIEDRTGVCVCVCT